MLPFETDFPRSNASDSEIISCSSASVSRNFCSMVDGHRKGKIWGMIDCHRKGKVETQLGT